MRSNRGFPGADLTPATLTKRYFGLRLRLFCAIAIIAGSSLLASPAQAMHLADGVLPLRWCAVWGALALPFVAVALRKWERERAAGLGNTPLVAMLGAAVFAISCMPVPVPTAGTCSHPCGTGLAAIFVGPSRAVLLTVVALVLQALFLAHGGITTLGADVMSMGIAGAFAGYGVFHLARRAGASLGVAAFAAGVLSDWATYSVTSLELALGLHGDRPIVPLFLTIGAAFIPTQLPLGLLEGAMTAGAVRFLARRRPDLLARIGLLKPPSNAAALDKLDKAGASA
jgi:cobalt/nickel transport system permease protein